MITTLFVWWLWFAVAVCLGLLLLMVVFILTNPRD